ncbi:MAG TPA: hypothetical protein VF066_00150 [Thermoleophilaceae bacterium]
MPSREERLAANEVRFREINESAQPQRESQGTGRFVCECADRSCMAWLEVPLADYLAVRQNPLRFIVAPSHEIPDVEDIIEREPGYFVIEKPEAVAHIVR